MSKDKDNIIPFPGVNLDDISKDDKVTQLDKELLREKYNKLMGKK